MEGGAYGSTRIEHPRTIEPFAWTAIGGASSPSFSKDGETTFHLRGAGLAQVWSMRRDSSSAVRLASQDEQAIKHRRAPSSDQLLWNIDAGGDERHQVWLLDPGGTPRALTRCGAWVAWSVGWR